MNSSIDKNMILINDLNEKMIKEILEVLYQDEIHNAILIELVEKHPENLGELYIGRDGSIKEVLHIKNDGNSDFTSFAYIAEEGLIKIGQKIKELSKRYKKILIGGRLEDVKTLLSIIECHKQVNPNIFYKLDLDKYRALEYRTNIRRADDSEEEIDIIRNFTLSFLEAETEDEINSIGDRKKIFDKIRNGLYLLQYKGNIIGMARFIGETKNFSEITSVYIDPKHRNKGFGKELISHMIEISLNMSKIPILETSESNITARKTYEDMGFVKIGDYAFEFI